MSTQIPEEKREAKKQIGVEIKESALREKINYSKILIIFYLFLIRMDAVTIELKQ